MPKYWLSHIHSISDDPLKDAELWEKLLGAKRISVTNAPDPQEGFKAVNVNMELNGTQIKVRVPRNPPLIPGSPVNSGLEHIALGTDNIQAAVEELKANGIRFLEELRELPSGDYLCYILAPGDVPVEILGSIEE